MNHIVKLLFLSFILGHLTGQAQNWALVNSADRYDYTLGSDPIPRFHIGVDSLEVVSGDTVWFLPTWPAPCDTCTDYDPLHCFQDRRYYPGLPQFLQREVRNLGSGVFEFSDTGSLFIETRALTGDSWILDPINGISAMVSLESDTLIFGATDSVKTISLSTGAEILLSKNHGVLYFPTADPMSEGYRLSGIYGRNLGNYVPGWKEFHNIQPGDKIQYLDYWGDIGYSFPGGPNYDYTTIRIRNFIDRKETATSITLIYEENWQREYQTYVVIPPVYELSHGSTIDSVTLTSELFWYGFGPMYRGAGLSELTNNEWFRNGGWGLQNDLESFWKYDIDSNGRFIKYSNTVPYSYDGCPGYFTYDMDEVVEPRHYSAQYGTYTEGIGLSYLWGVSGKDSEHLWQITAYIHDGDTVGEFDPAIDWALGSDAPLPNDFEIYPNPAQYSIQLKGLHQTGSWQITNLAGQSLAAGELAATIDVSALAKGFYLLVVETSDGKKGTQKFVKN